MKPPYMWSVLDWNSCYVAHDCALFLNILYVLLLRVYWTIIQTHSLPSQGLSSNTGENINQIINKIVAMYKGLWTWDINTMHCGSEYLWEPWAHYFISLALNPHLENGSHLPFWFCVKLLFSSCCQGIVSPYCSPCARFYTWTQFKCLLNRIEEWEVKALQMGMRSHLSVTPPQDLLSNNTQWSLFTEWMSEVTPCISFWKAS